MREIGARGIDLHQEQAGDDIADIEAVAGLRRVAGQQPEMRTVGMAADEFNRHIPDIILQGMRRQGCGREALGMETHDHDLQGRACRIGQVVLHGNRQIDKILGLQGDLLCAIVGLAVALQHDIELFLVGILHRRTGTMGIDIHYAIARDAAQHRGLLLTLAEQRMIMAGRSADVGWLLRRGVGVAIEESGIDLALGGESRGQRQEKTSQHRHGARLFSVKSHGPHLTSAPECPRWPPGPGDWSRRDHSRWNC